MTFTLEEENKLEGPSKEYQKYLSNLNEWTENRMKITGTKTTNDTLEFYKEELNYIETTLFDDLKRKKDEIIEKIKDIFQKKKQILGIYTNIKKGIDSKISANSRLLENYNINIGASLGLNENYSKEFFSYINQNKAGSFYSKDGGKIQLEKLLNSKNLNVEEDIINLINEIIDYLSRDKRDKQEDIDRFIDDQIVNLEEFYNFLFSLNYLEYNYELKLGDKEIEELSPGERGTSLLIFYLLLDKNDTPLILDQPEDNLDNNSVANVLVPFIKEAKQTRQIILVTHNPNLAVVADAEQIIWVDIDKKNQNKFKFISGSIENKEINGKLVEVLEGAMPAFNKRKEKYYE